MKNRKIKQSIYRAVQEAPIDLLDKIKNQPVDKLEMHDYITKQETQSQMQHRWKPIFVLGTFAALFIAVFIGWMAQYRLVDSIVYFDVNPSIEIVTDKNEQVVRLHAIDQNNKALLEGIDYKGESLYLVIEELLKVMIAKGHIDTMNRLILISVMNNNLEKSKIQTANLNTVIHEYLEEYDIRPVVLRQSITKSNTIDEYAGKYNISIGKMTFIRNLIILNQDFKEDELAVLSLEELVVLSSQTRLDIKSIIEVDDELDEFSNDDDYDNKSPGKKLIDRENAIKIAQNLTDGGIVMRFEQYEDDDHYTYGIEIISDGKIYEIEIDAYTGKVMKFEVVEDDDYENMQTGQVIGQEKAIQIALGLTDGGTVIRCELYEDDDYYTYGIEIIKDSKEYEIKIDAYTGKVLEFETDDDDDDDDDYESIQTGKLIGREKAIQIALGLTDSGIVMRFEQYEDDDHYTYGIEIIREGKEYEIEIDAYTGDVMELQSDDNDDYESIQTGKLIGHEKASQTAQGLTGGGIVVSFELYEDNDHYTYGIKIIKDGNESMIEINAYTGKVLEHEIDN